MVDQQEVRLPIFPDTCLGHWGSVSEEMTEPVVRSTVCSQDGAHTSSVMFESSMALLHLPPIELESLQAPFHSQFHRFVQLAIQLNIGGR